MEPALGLMLAVAEEGDGLMLMLESRRQIHVCQSGRRGAVDLTEEKVVPELHLTGGGEFSEDSWYLDNGASNHMIGDPRKFAELDGGVTGKVKFGDGSSVQIEGKGSILFRCRDGEHWLLRDVYYIPKLKSNLVSLGQLTEDGCKVEMDEDVLKVFEKRPMRLLLKVQRSSNRLYRVDMKPVMSECLMGSVEELEWLWHGRLGHVNFRTLKMVGEKEMVGGVPVINQPDKLCHPCLAGKQTRQPFPSATSFRAQQALELIYVDLCGPITPSTAAGNKYFILFVDDHTRFMHVYMLKSKDQATAALEKYKAEVENAAEKKIKTIRSDHGGGSFCQQLL
jgi:hypothetical protein